MSKWQKTTGVPPCIWGLTVFFLNKASCCSLNIFPVFYIRSEESLDIVRKLRPQFLFAMSSVIYYWSFVDCTVVQLVLCQGHAKLFNLTIPANLKLMKKLKFNKTDVILLCLYPKFIIENFPLYTERNTLFSISNNHYKIFYF